MNKQQSLLVGGALAALLLLFFFGKTVSPQKGSSPVAQQPQNNTSAAITLNDILISAKENLTAAQLSYISQLENSVVRGDVKPREIKAYHLLAGFWGDSLHHSELEGYYLGESAKLENSEKNLTFAARLLLDGAMTDENTARENWMAIKAKELFEMALSINPDNDSSKIGIGACYMFGSISGNPMQGILTIRQIAEKNPDNLYAQMMLGLGGIKSGQYDKAIERFLIVVSKQPGNLEAILNLAETYERTGDKANAIKWYGTAEKMITLPEARKELETRIRLLQKNNS